jgi:hypothetical protein
MFATRNFVFISVPKTASTTINFYLRDRNVSIQSPLEISSLHSPPEQYHKSINELYKDHFRECAESECFKFAFVRNPWDRLVSAYYDFKTLRGTHIDRRRIPSFNVFCENLIESKWVENVHFRPQHTFLEFKNGDPYDTMDYIGRYENLQEDLSTIFNRCNGILGINIETWLSLAPKYRETRSSREHYTEFYNDQTRELVRKIYEKDIELFEYEY